MLLAIDCGNTNTVFGIHDGTSWIAQWRISTVSVRTADEYSSWLYPLLMMNRIQCQDIKSCIISTVVPQSLFHLRNFVKRYLKISAIVVGENATLPITVAIDNPKEAGADRLVNAIAGYRKYGGGLLIIDSGTATTFDLIGLNGDFEGGVICPGISLSVLALHQAAAKLPRVEIKQTQKVIGKNTVHAMQSGIFWGYISLIEGLITKLKAETLFPLKVIATGGIVSLFEGATTAIDYFDANLTMDGLLDIYRGNS